MSLPAGQMSNSHHCPGNDRQIGPLAWAGARHLKQQTAGPPGPRVACLDNHGCAEQGGKPHPPPITSRMCPAGSAQSHPHLLAHGPGSPPRFQGRAGTPSFTQQTAELNDAQNEVARGTSPVGLNLEKPEAQRALLQQERAPVRKQGLMTQL